MDNKYNVRIMRSEIHYLKNVNFGEVTYMNHGCINTRGIIEKPDVIGIYGQNGSGKTALVESLDILKYVLMGIGVPYDRYAGIISKEEQTKIITDFYIEIAGQKYKASFAFDLSVNEQTRSIDITKEKLIYWQRGSAWKKERDIEFENPDYDSMDLLEQENLSVKSEHANNLKAIPFLWSMDKLAFACAQRHISVFFNKFVFDACKSLKDEEAIVFGHIITGLIQFGAVDLNVIKVDQLGQINSNIVIPINGRSTTENSITQSRIILHVAKESDIESDLYDVAKQTIDAINVALKSIVPNLQIELEKKAEYEQQDGEKAYKVDIYSKRDEKRFLLRYESEGIKRIISILNYLISAYNDPGVCLVIDELDSGIFEYLLGELLELMHEEMKGQLIFTSHNLRVLEKFDAKNIICSTTNPNNRFIRMVGIEKNHNKRDFYMRALSVGGQKEELYDEEDLIAMGYAFRKAGKLENKVSIPFSPRVEEILQEVN